MYVDSCDTISNGKTYTRHLLRKSYREGGKVKHDTIANITDCSDEEIAAIKLALRYKKDLTCLGTVKEDLSTHQGSSVGAVWLLHSMSKRLGIVKALGNSREGKLALWQVLARVIDQGSRLSAVRLAGRTTACDVLGLGSFNEDHLYKNLEWLYAKQEKIEDRLYRFRRGEEKGGLFLYDVTSSYLEGDHNELGDWGYNRDKKKGKKQIVAGLLCDEEGAPVSIQLYRGNTQDGTTFGDQVRKVSDRFGGEGEVTLIGDRGMIKGPQMEELRGEGFHYITAITKAQIRKLMKEGVLQLELFDEEVGEVVTEEGDRYIFRRNPARAEEIQKTREEKMRSLLKKTRAKNEYLKEHPRAKESVGMRDVEAYAKKVKISGWAKVIGTDRVLRIEIDAEKLEKESELDGCYVLKTDVNKETLSKERAHERYKDLKLVEEAFRTSKTEVLEMRPLYLRNEIRTRGYGVVVMLAYCLIRELKRCWVNLEYTVNEGIKELQTLCTTEIRLRGKPLLHEIPEPNEGNRALLAAAGVHLPEALPNRGVKVATRKKLSLKRKRR